MGEVIIGVVLMYYLSVKVCPKSIQAISRCNSQNGEGCVCEDVKVIPGFFIMLIVKRAS